MLMGRHCALHAGSLNLPQVYKSLDCLLDALLLFFELITVFHPLKPACWQRLAHGLAIEIISIHIEDVAVGVSRVIALNQRVVSLCTVL